MEGNEEGIKWQRQCDQLATEVKKVRKRICEKVIGESKKQGSKVLSHDC